MTRARMLWRIARGTIVGFLRHEGPIMAGHMAFLGLLSLFPFFIFLMALAGLVGGTELGRQAIEQMLAAAPAEVSRIIAKPLKEVLDGAGKGILTFGILVVIWTAANGIEAARTAIRRAYWRRPIRAAWSRRLESLALVFVAATLILIGMAVQVLGPVGWRLLNDFVPMPSFLEMFWQWLRFFFSPLVMFAALYGTYFALSPRRIAPQFRLPGAVLALCVWIATANGLSLYLEYFGRYDITYGSLGGVMIVLIFLYLIGMGFILGAELNAACVRHALMMKRQRRRQMEEGSKA
ncbi:MAG: YihY/virulence factor BrkB family protein [Alphaproteobacteria bacterium]|nr:MAG: YihY/virulence factor BrkB family protein [Alphaproteobacteria bacterium]